jgi:hypothetical protein
MISDRDLIVGLYEAIGRLAQRLTGESLRIKIVDSQTGERFRMRTPIHHSCFINDVDAESENAIHFGVSEAPSALVLVAASTQQTGTPRAAAEKAEAVPPQHRREGHRKRARLPRERAAMSSARQRMLRK